jgi:hypothetical protein
MTAANFLVSEIRTAEIDSTERFRYNFTWIWDLTGPRALFAGLNPSKADALTDDHTVLKWRGFSKRLGCGGYEGVNPFAYRATDPKQLVTEIDVIGGPRNDDAILEAASRCDLIVVCWGCPPSRLLYPRIRHVEELLRRLGRPLKCWGRTKGGWPRHPLMLPYSTPLEDF